MTELQEAYKVMQEHCGIEVGDTVKVVRAPFDGEADKEYGKHWRNRIGNIYRVDNIDSTPGRFGLAHSGKNMYSGDYNVPFYCLELVEKAKSELPPIMIAGRAVEFFGASIGLGGGVIVSKAILLQILERLEN